MFSNNKANPLTLLIPSFLVIAILVLSVLIFGKLNSKSIVEADKNVPAANTSVTNTIKPTNLNPDNKTDEGTGTKNSPSQESFNKALNSVPTSGYPDNKCPSHLILESSGNSFAIDGEQKYMLSQNSKTWIQKNCPNTKTLNY